jgi:hypothetical protein
LYDLCRTQNIIVQIAMYCLVLAKNTNYESWSLSIFFLTYINLYLVKNISRRNNNISNKYENKICVFFTYDNNSL